MSSLSTPKPVPKSVTPEIQVGPIISWPFFGSNRGELSHPNEIDRGPWRTTYDYLLSCAEREIAGVIRENEGKSAPHRLHLDPAEIMSSRHHHLNALPGDKSDDSEEWDLEESEEEWEGPGDVMYRDYRRMQRSTFLVAHMATREQSVRKEMQRWMRLAERLGVRRESTHTEEFGLDCHDLSLENVFVDEHDNAKITCIIDWESTTTRPLWACAHLPAFLQSSAFTADLFRKAVQKLATVHPSPVPHHALNGRQHTDLAALAHEWLHYESTGARLRVAHRFMEWDGWEEGLIDSILGPEEQEDDWFHDLSSPLPDGTSPPSFSESTKCDSDGSSMLPVSLARRKAPSKLPFVKEKEKQQVLNTTGDICGGRGGELGRRLEAWLVTDGGQQVKGGCREDDEDYDAAHDIDIDINFLSCELGIRRCCQTTPNLLLLVMDSDLSLTYDPLNPATFILPSPLPTPRVTIEFCDRCRWLHRASWVSTELFLTFPPPVLKAISVLPLNAEETAGRFRVWLTLDAELPVLVWDRKVDGGFPELKELKQRIRDRVEPGKSLGHSDKK